jgi:hypothetical protein
MTQQLMKQLPKEVQWPSTELSVVTRNQASCGASGSEDGANGTLGKAASESGVPIADSSFAVRKAPRRMSADQK